MGRMGLMRPLSLSGHQLQDVDDRIRRHAHTSFTSSWLLFPAPSVRGVVGVPGVLGVSLQLSAATPCTADESSFLKDYLCKPRSLIFRREHPLVRGWLCATRCWRTRTEPTGFWRYGWEFGWRSPRSNALANSGFLGSTKFNRPTWPDAVQW